MRFWRNVTLIAVAHAIAFIALLRWAGNTKAASAEEITWLSGGETSEAGEPGSTPEVSPSQDRAEEEAPDLETTPAPSSEIVLPKTEPTSTPSPPVTPSVARKKPTATPSVKPKKKAASKASATPAKAKAEVSNRKKQIASSTPGKSAKPGATPSSGASGNAANSGGAKADAATASYYSNMLHDRFYRAWDQPQTVVASGARFSAIARIRIERDGRVSDFKIVRPSGNVLVDESVAAAGRKVTRVDALPAGVGSAGRYDVHVSFELNPN